MKKAEQEVFADAIVGAIKSALEGPLVRGRIDALEARIIALETRPQGVKYAGIYRTGETYAEGQLTTHQGGLWLATSSTTFAPGVEGSGWKLIVKSGQAR